MFTFLMDDLRSVLGLVFWELLLLLGEWKAWTVLCWKPWQEWQLYYICSRLSNAFPVLSTHIPEICFFLKVLLCFTRRQEIQINVWYLKTPRISWWEAFFTPVLNLRYFLKKQEVWGGYVEGLSFSSSHSQEPRSVVFCLFLQNRTLYILFSTFWGG